MEKLTVEAFDNRGTKEVPFGYVYFSDNTRMVVGVADNVTTLMSGQWGGNTEEHIQLAADYLKEQGFKLH